MSLGSPRSDACIGWSTAFGCVRCALIGCALPPLPVSAAATGRAVGLDELQPTQNRRQSVPNLVLSIGEEAHPMYVPYCASGGILSSLLSAANRTASQAVGEATLGCWLAVAVRSVGAYEAARARRRAISRAKTSLFILPLFSTATHSYNVFTPVSLLLFKCQQCSAYNDCDSTKLW